MMILFIDRRKCISLLFTIKISHKVVNSISALWYTSKSEHTTVVPSILDSKSLKTIYNRLFCNLLY